MDKALLRWGLENSESSELKASCERAKQWDPELINHVLGQSDAKKIIECMQTAFPTEKTSVELSTRLQALDHLELLVESVDNANDLKALNMWDGLLNGLNDDEDEIRKMLCWIIGTAIQNNTTALSHLLDHDGLRRLMDLGKSESSPDVLSKWIYALVSCVQDPPNEQVLHVFLENDGISLVHRLANSTQDQYLLDKLKYLLEKFASKYPSHEQLFSLSNKA